MNRMKLSLMFLVALLTSASVALLQAEQEGSDSSSSKIQLATFAGGCFWCMEPPFEKLKGVFSVRSGYSGGQKKNPTYQEVSAGITKYAESVQIEFDPDIITYQELLEVYWRNTDPTVSDRQFCDKGHQYRPAIFYHDSTQKEAAEKSKSAIETSGKLPKPIVTEITQFTSFYPAEEYHQDYYKKNPSNYKSYRKGCGRDRRLKQLWGN